MGKERELLHWVLSLSFLTVLAKNKSRRDNSEDSPLLHKTVIFPWRATHSLCYFCGRKEKKSFWKMFPPPASCDESLWQHK